MTTYTVRRAEMYGPAWADTTRNTAAPTAHQTEQVTNPAAGVNPMAGGIRWESVPDGSLGNEGDAEDLFCFPAKNRWGVGGRFGDE